MKLMYAISAVVLGLPVLLIVAVALGPVILGLLCAGLFGLIVFALWSFVVGLGMFGRSLGQRRARAQESRYDR
jgi:hypothetical protein